MKRLIMGIYKFRYCFIIISILHLFSCIAQNENTSKSLQIVGGPCEGCEAALEFGNKKLNSIDTLPKFSQTNPKLKIEGTIYLKDGKTPAENIILYVYHTDRNGIYLTEGNEDGWAKRHGIIRGWIKTGADGRYTIYTFRPASYPNRKTPQHIHFTIKEPDKIPYYIEDVFFEDDPFLTESFKNDLENRGGSGVVIPKSEDDYLKIERDIILGLNIPDYN